MKVTMIAVGSRGDVQPYVALGMGLQAAGHTVTLATHPDFEDFITAHGLRFHLLGRSVRAMVESDHGRRMLSSGSNPWPFVLGFKRIFETYADEFLEQSLAACEGAGAIIFSIFGSSGYHIAEKMRVPSFAAFLQPMSRTSYFPLQPPAHDWFRLRLYNRFTFIAGQQMFGQTFMDIMQRWRRTLGLPPLDRGGLYSLIDLKRLPTLYGYSPTAVPRPPDWPPQFHVTGYWFLDRPADWQPPAELLDFLQAGKPPVYVGFGSMSTTDPRGSAELVVNALQKAGQRAVLLSGWSALHHADLPDDIFCIDSAPHDWLFPRMAAVVHHGGAGTTGAALRAGVPSFAVPFFGDQYFWADRVRRLGVGPHFIPQNRLSVDGLARAIHTVATNHHMRGRAAAIGRRIRAEDGIAAAVRAFNSHF